jgi:hypothetical protein
MTKIMPRKLHIGAIRTQRLAKLVVEVDSNPPKDAAVPSVVIFRIMKPRVVPIVVKLVVGEEAMSVVREEAMRRSH